MAIEIIEYTLPEYWASFLVNDDASGLEEEEIQEIRQFLSTLNPGEYCVSVKADSSFYHSNDAGTLAGNCSTFIFHKYTK